MADLMIHNIKIIPTKHLSEHLTVVGGTAVKVLVLDGPTTRFLHTYKNNRMAQYVLLIHGFAPTSITFFRALGVSSLGEETIASWAALLGPDLILLPIAKGLKMFNPSNDFDEEFIKYILQSDYGDLAPKVRGILFPVHLM